jgi:NADH-quinone oxidoreductase subunit E
MLRGAEDMVDHLKKATGVKEAGQVSPEGLFSYEEVECMGACEYAPMLRLDHRYHYDLTPEKIDQLVAERRSPSPLSTERGQGDAKPKRAPRKKADG